MNQSDSHLFKLTSIIFDAALGNTYYNQFSSTLEQVGIDALAISWGESDVAKSILGSSPEAQAKTLARNIGLNPDSTDQQSGDYVAYQFFVANLQSGMNVGSLALAAIRYLEQDIILDSLEATRSYLNNRAEVAYQYSTDLGFGGTDVKSLQDALDDVTADESSISISLKKASNDAFEAIRASSTIIDYSSDDDVITGTDGSDYIDAKSGYDTVNGGTGADIIIGGSGDDLLYGERGQDMLEGGDGADFLNAGSYYSSDYIRGHYNDDNEYIDGYYTYSVEAFFEVLNGGSGTDTVYGGYGSDAISGGEGDDKLYGEGYRYTELSDDALSNFDSSTLLRLMNDTIAGGAGADSIYGQQGNDSINGGDGDDYIDAGSGNDIVSGDAGNDRIWGQSGADSIAGGEGNDEIIGGYGADTVYGGVGNDTIYLGRSASYSYSYSDDAIDMAYGEDGNDSIYGSANDNIDAGKGNDYVYLFRADDSSEQSVIIAGEGSDFVFIDSGDGYYEPGKASTILTVNLAETTASIDTVGFYLASRITSAVEIQDFDLSMDRIDLNWHVDLYNDNAAQFVTTAQKFNSDGDLSVNYVQIVNSASTAWTERVENPVKPDEYGKGYFVIQGAQAASSDIADVASLIDSYGNNATYGKSDEHIFIVNVNDTDLGIYLFTDDTGANDRVVSDELKPLVLLTGVTTDDITYDNADFLIS